METIDIILRNHRKSIAMLESSVEKLTEYSSTNLKCWKKQRSFNRKESVMIFILAVAVWKQMAKIRELEEKIGSVEITDEDKEE